MKPRVTVRGLDTLAANCAAIRRGLDRALDQIRPRAAEPLVAAARRRARRKTGRMAASIRAATPSEGGRLAWAGERVEYTGVQHFGWPARGITPNMFLYDAADDTERRVVDTVDRETWSWIDRTWRDTR